MFGAYGEQQPTLIRVLRLTRVLRTLRLLRVARGLSMLVSIFLVSMAGLLNVLGVYMIVLAVYSLLAMQLFGRVAHGDFLNTDANFCTFAYALLTMFRCATGEEWNGIMHEAMASSVGPWVAIPYFVSYVLLSTYIVLKVRGW